MPVGQYPPNAFGLYDMAGNVAEWCLDAWDFYTEEPQENPFPGGGIKARDETIHNYETVKGKRVTRGGSYLAGNAGIHVAARHPGDVRKPLVNLGFRCARDASP